MDSNVNMSEDEIDLKEVFRTLYRYKIMIILFVLFFGAVSAYYAYFKPSIYQASSTVEVGLQKRGYGGGGDVLSMAMDPGVMNPSTEMEIIQSRFLAKKALEKVDFSHHYYTTRRYREVELYKDAPFKVGMLTGFGISFNLYDVNETHYRLSVEKAVDENGTEWEYDKVLPYGTEIVEKQFHLNVVCTAPLEDSSYRFVIDKENWPNGKVSVAQTSKFSMILRISYEDNVPLRAQEYANALADAYIRQNIEKKTKEATLKLDFIDKQLKKITENLKSSAVKIEEFKKSSKTISLSSKAEVIIKQMSESEARLETISMERELLNSLYKRIKKGKNLESISVAGIGSGQKALAEQVRALQEAVMKKRILREDYTELYPGVVKLRKQISYLKKTITDTIKNLKGSIDEQKRLLEKSLKKYQKNLNVLPADERMFGQLQRKFAVNEKIYSYLLEKRSETAILKAATVSKNRIIDTALLPKAPVKPKRKLIVLVGLILGLILGIAVAFLRNFLDDRIQSEEDIKHLTQTPLLGFIPHMREDNNKLKVLISPKSAVSEAFRNLRTNLQFMVRKERSHVISVTSTIGGEGKTTICINLAAIMSIADKKTIVINLDMRKPTLHEKFDLSNQHGMSTLLAGSTTLAKVIQKTEYENLDVITSGPVPPNPSELIQSELMEKVVEKLREVYDVIILDTPPIGLVTDARTLMHLSDTSIYVMRAGHSKKGFVQKIKELSQLQEIHGLAILLNDVKIDRSGYGYGYGYGYSYGYYEEDKK
jgi:capsular exopolysaccharide synthesis family protein